MNKSFVVALSFLLCSCSNLSLLDNHECVVTCKICEDVKLTCKNGESGKIKVNEESSDDELNGQQASRMWRNYYAQD